MVKIHSPERLKWFDVLAVNSISSVAHKNHTCQVNDLKLYWKFLRDIKPSPYKPAGLTKSLSSWYTDRTKRLKSTEFRQTSFLLLHLAAGCWDVGLEQFLSLRWSWWKEIWLRPLFHSWDRTCWSPPWSVRRFHRFFSSYWAPQLRQRYIITRLPIASLLTHLAS